ncbi:hypothetical protein [Polaribacter staleyi]|uniref:hypothetical protein n=1 Tax=Polaribacter staleyi TaxID=2022337 RepID=UPI0031BBB7F0
MKNWKLIFSILFSTLILYNSLRVSITYIYYNLDTAGFIETFCENKDKPELQCNGKCHLKKITKTANQEKNQPVELINFKDILVYNQKISSFHFTKNTYQNKPTFQYLNLYYFKLSTTYFHPPNA